MTDSNAVKPYQTPLQEAFDHLNKAYTEAKMLTTRYAGLKPMRQGPYHGQYKYNYELEEIYDAVAGSLKAERDFLNRMMSQERQSRVGQAVEMLGRIALFTATEFAVPQESINRSVDKGVIAVLKSLKEKLAMQPVAKPQEGGAKKK